MVDTVPFMSLLSNIVDNRGKTCPVSEHGMPLIATNCVKNNVLYPVFEKVRYVSEATYQEWFRGHPEPGDLIFVTKGSPGNVCMAPDPVNFCIAQDMVAIRADESKIYPKYLFAVLRSREVQANIENMHVGTLIPHFKKGDFDKLFLPVPDSEVQEYVGDCHFDLCAKFELNQRMNETLEAMAKALFKSWFVDFDPVRAKAEGRKPEGMDAATAVLFPATFNDDGLPEGWSLQKVSDVLELSYGKALKKEERVAGNVPVYGSGGVTGFHNEALVEGPGIIVGRKGTVGSLYWEQRNFYPIDTVFYVVPNKDYSLEYTYYLLQTLGLETMNTDAAVPGLNRNNAYRLDVVKTSPEIIAAFTKIVSVWRNLIDTNVSETWTLANLRDALLPKLISGELRIDEGKGKRGK